MSAGAQNFEITDRQGAHSGKYSILSYVKQTGFKNVQRINSSVESRTTCVLSLYCSHAYIHQKSHFANK